MIPVRNEAEEEIVFFLNEILTFYTKITIEPSHQGHSQRSYPTTNLVAMDTTISFMTTDNYQVLQLRTNHSTNIVILNHCHVV